ncbi:MAG TPA: ATP-binding protein, partial [Candidatus Baltobacteraceae bacterium]|nr:ATP-binding protein [Candidatus Baltobacteraceae bacterium]
MERSRKDRVPTIIEIEGEAGIGKSALIQAATAHARASGWLAAVATCYAIQSQIPLSTTRRLLRELLEAMGDEREHYATGLQRVLESSAPNAGAQGLTRLLDGVTLDRPVLLAIDDAQWADADSLEFIGDLLSNSSARAIAVLEATRPRANGVHLTPNTVIPLHPLDDRHARAVARRLLPSTAPNVIDAIVNHARGYPIDIVALANAIADRNHPSIDDVASSRRSAIARDVRSAAPPLREFLQVCSLMGGPIAYRLLERLWPDRESLDALVTLCTGRYLRTTDLGLEFEHDLIAEAVRQTIAIPSPYRRKIIAALQSLESPSLEELQALASQLAECADRIGAFSVLADVARKAAAAGQTRLTVSASTQALNFADPPLDYARTFLPDYADALFALDRDSEAVSVIERALRLFDRAGANLPGSAVARLILALCFSDQLSTAQSTYARFLPTMRNTADRAHLLSAAIWFAVCHDNLEQAESLEKEILLLPGDLPFTVKIRMRNFKAFVLSLHGNHDAAMALLDEAAAIAREAALLGPIGITTDQINVPKLFLSTWEYGTRVLEPLVEERHRASYDEERTPADEYFLAFAEFLAGHWNRAEARIAGVVDRNPRPTATRRFLTLAAAIAALRQCDSPYRKTIEGDVSAFLLGRREGWFVPVAAWWAAVTAQS